MVRPPATRRTWRLASLPIVLAFAILPLHAGLGEEAARTTAGQLDPTFDGDGIAITEITSHVDGVSDTEVQRLPDGSERLLVLDTHGRVWRFLTDGALDTTFDSDGVLPAPTTDPPISPKRLATLDDGRFVLGGPVFVEGSLNLGATRHLPDGALDDTFSDDGFVRLGPRPGERFASFADVAVQSPTSGSRVVLLGSGAVSQVEFGEFAGAVAVRVTPDGIGTPTYHWVVGPNNPPRPRSAVIPGDDSIVISAAVGTDGVAVIRLTAGLERDLGFGDAGVAIESPIGFNFGDLPVVVQSDGTVVVLSSHQSDPGAPEAWQLLRWDASGVFLGATPTEFAPESPNGALRFDGENDFVAIPNTSGDFNFETAFTVEAWVRPESLVSGGGFAAVVQHAMSVPPFSGSAWTLFLHRDDHSRWGLSVCVPGCESASSGNGNLQVGQWQHLAATHDGSEIRVYRNGELIDVEPHTGQVSNANVLLMGIWEESLHGLIDEVRVWNVARSQSDISATMNQTLDGERPGLVGYWRFDEQSGQVALDSSGAGNDGHLGAGPADEPSDPERVVSDAPIYLNVTPGDLALMPDDRIVAVGRASFPLTHEHPDVVAVATYTAAGENTGEMGTTVAHPDGTTDLAALRLARLGDGRFAVVGRAEPDVAGLRIRQLLLANLTDDGTFDDAFGADGFVTHHAGEDLAEAVATLGDGSILVGGGIPETGSESSSGFVAKHQIEGALDGTFTRDPFAGIRITSFPDLSPTDGFGELEVVVHALATDVDGRNVIAGRGGGFGEGEPGVIHRMLPDGSPDATFNGGEPVRLESGTDRTILHGVAVDAAGRIVAVGSAVDMVGGPASGGGASILAVPPVEPNGDAVVVRLLPDGTLDEAFGTGGVVRFEEGASAASSVVIDATGRISITGWLQRSSEAAPRLLAARLRAEDGAGDSSFGSDAEFSDGVRAGPLRFVGADLALTAAGVAITGHQLVADAGGELPAVAHAFVVHHLDDGSLDPEFGVELVDGAGVARPVGTEPSSANGIAVDSAGDLVVAGSHTPSADLFVARLLPTGLADTTFGTDGIVLTDTGGTESASDVAIAPDGKIVVAGQVTDDRGTRVLVARYHPGAALDCLPPELDLGEQIVGDGYSTSTVTCMNTERGPLSVTSVATDGPHASDFVTTPDACVGATLPASTACQVEVTFTPTGVGARSATLRITHTGGDAPDLITLRGSGMQRRGLADCQPTEVDRGEQLVGEGSTSMVTCTNTGPGPVTVTGVAIEGPHASDFGAPPDACVGVTLDPGASCQIPITFTPAAVGPRSATLRVTPTGDAGQALISLRGSGRIQGVPAFATSPEEVDFGELLARSTSPPQTVTVTNQGTEPFTVNTVSIEGPQADDMRILATTCRGTEVAPAASCIVTLNYRPDQAVPQDRAAFLEFTDTAPGSPHTVSLRGAVARPQLRANPAVLPPERVTTVFGRGFPADEPVQLGFGPGFLERATVVAGSDGTFRVPVLMFPKTRLGPRTLTASSPDPTVPTDLDRTVTSTVDVLVAPRSVQPPDFTSRN